VLDLGPWGAVSTEGWDRHVVSQAAAAKRTRQIINCQRIYLPQNRNRAEILAAAAPVDQTPPADRAERGVSKRSAKRLQEPILRPPAQGFLRITANA
jgi:NADH dehydrogenase